VRVAADWVTISSLATAAGTLVLAVATFGSVRSANRAARVAELSLMAGLRPLLLPSRLQDLEQKVGFQDGKWIVVTGGGAVAEVGPDAIYLAMSLRNVATGLAILHGWHFYPERLLGPDTAPAALDDFHMLTRDLYVPAGDIGFWQGTFRDAATDEFAAAKAAIEGRVGVTIDLLYGDQEGSQRVISRYTFIARDDGSWLAAASRHWNVDGHAPR
jgi:hypothetical protein